MTGSITISLIGDKKLEVKPDSFKKELTIMLPIDVDDDMTIGFIESLVSGYQDIFSTNYIGYWAWGLYYDKAKNRWLCLEHDDDPSLMIEHEENILERYKEWGDEAPCGYDLRSLYYDPKQKTLGAYLVTDNKEGMIRVFIIDLSFAMRAVACVVKRKGMKEMSNWDANTIDLGVQLALFGKIVYG